MPRRELTLSYFQNLAARLLGAVVATLPIAAAQTQPTPDVFESITNIQQGRMVFKEGQVLFRPQEKQPLPAVEPQPLTIGDGLHTLTNARAAVSFNDGSGIRMAQLTRLYLIQTSNTFAIFQPQGKSYVASRGVAGRAMLVTTPNSSLKPRGTEYLVEVDPAAGRTDITMFDGEAEISDGQSTNIVRTGEQGMVIAGQGIRVRPILEATNIVQWWLYYPGVLDLEELDGLDELNELSRSVAAYKAGDLHQALEEYPGYPDPPEPTTDSQRLYLAGLFLAVGAVDKTQALLDKANTNTPPARALTILIEAVQKPVDGRSELMADSTSTTTPAPRLSTINQSPSFLLALSYLHQSQHQLEEALAAARAATAKSPNFAFAWERVAELEFSFGRTRRAQRALTRALELGPRNAQAHALRGFLLAAENRTREAIVAFDQAIELDPALGNAWLGRGLCKHRLSLQLPIPTPKFFTFNPSALDELATAALLEPNRSLVHSYLGKAFADSEDFLRAGKELDYAKRLDSNDPTPWLYSALWRRDQNQINPAVDDLEQSIERNDNRAVYRSQLLLDQDQAVRGANLAVIYREAGMTDVSLREAIRAVNTEYANYSAHLFLANTYNELRDPRQINLRYETPWLTEYLTANLLAPVGAGTLSPQVTQQEYSRLFERNRFGLSSATEYRSQGDWLQSAVQYGIWNDFSYAAEVAYRSENGHRPNNDLDQLTTSLKLKQQLTPNDSVFLQGSYYRAEGGDLRPYYDESAPHGLGGPDRFLRFEETQEPLLLAGYHHQWRPGWHSLFLGGRVQDTFSADTPGQPALVLLRDPAGEVVRVDTGFMAQDFRNKTELYTAELQQILQTHPLTWIFGGRYQAGSFETDFQPGVTNGAFPNGPAAFFDTRPQQVDTELERITGYGYINWEVVEPLVLSAGLSYDRLTYPENFRSPPLSSKEEDTARLSPKAGVLWTVMSNTTLRAAYTRSLGGVTFDQSFRLEPSQVAGFNQTFRSIMPEAVEGANAAARFETYGLALDQKFPSRTYFGLRAELLRSNLERELGVFEDRIGGPLSILPSGTRQCLDYEERALSAAVNQLLSEEWSVGAHYRWSQADLEGEFPGVPASAFSDGFRRGEDLEARLHQLQLFVLFNHSSGFFSQIDSIWSAQGNHGYSPERPDEDFWQFNASVGYRFPRRRAEVSVGLLNLTDQDYRLNPLNLTAELPRERTFVASLRLNF